MNGNVMFEVKDLCKSFGELQVLKGLNETFYKGDVAAVIGPSGSGKSTFIRCLNLLEQPTSGSIFFEGTDITAKGFDVNKHRQKVGMVFQQFNLFNNLSILDNVTISMEKVKHVSHAEAEAKAMAEKLAGLSVTLKMKAGEGGRAFGSISGKEIAAAAKDQLGLELDKKKLVLPEPLKTFGTHEVPVKLHKDVTGKLTVKVVEA